MFDLQILRSTSFALVTTGWSPDDVDAHLEGLCAQIEDGTINAGEEAARLREADFETSSPGYDPDDVRAFYARLADDLDELLGAAESPAPAEEPVAVGRGAGRRGRGAGRRGRGARCSGRGAGGRGSCRRR